MKIPSNLLLVIIIIINIIIIVIIIIIIINNNNRYTRRHNSILKAVGDYLASARKDMNLFCDIDGYKSSSIITGDQLRSDMVITDASSNSIFVVE